MGKKQDKVDSAAGKLGLKKETLRKLTTIAKDQLAPVAGGACWPSGGWTHGGSHYC